MKKRSFLLGSLLAFTLGVSAQSYSLRTNVLGLATTNLNLEASMTLGRKWSLHLPVQYNPFRFSRNRQFRNLYVAPVYATGCSRAIWGHLSACTAPPVHTVWETSSAAGTAMKVKATVWA
jgi:hypothetical protein